MADNALTMTYENVRVKQHNFNKKYCDLMLLHQLIVDGIKCQRRYYKCTILQCDNTVKFQCTARATIITVVIKVQLNTNWIIQYEPMTSKNNYNNSCELSKLNFNIIH